VNYPGKRRFNCDICGFLPGLKDAGLQKDQGDEVLVEPGLIVLSLNKHSSPEILNANIIVFTKFTIILKTRAFKSENRKAVGFYI